MVNQLQTTSQQKNLVLKNCILAIFQRAVKTSKWQIHCPATNNIKQNSWTFSVMRNQWQQQTNRTQPTLLSKNEQLAVDQPTSLMKKRSHLSIFLKESKGSPKQQQHPTADLSNKTSKTKSFTHPLTWLCISISQSKHKRNQTWLWLEAIFSIIFLSWKTNCSHTNHFGQGRKTITHSHSKNSPCYFAFQIFCPKTQKHQTLLAAREPT